MITVIHAWHLIQTPATAPADVPISFEAMQSIMTLLKKNYFKMNCDEKVVSLRLVRIPARHTLDLSDSIVMERGDRICMLK